MKLKDTAIITCLLFVLAQSGYSQNANPTDFFAGIKQSDVSKLWFNEETRLENDSISSAVPEPLGFIGDKYQRLYIHYSFIVKSKTNPYQYFVKGKTMVKDHVCNFSGTITISKAAFYKQQTDPLYKQGSLESEVLLKEDSAQNASGIITGHMDTKFYLDEKKTIMYDDLMVGADGYFNNQCEGVWRGYHSKKSKKCNWGDYRIPQSKALDSGDGEFAVDKKYDLYGWKNYRIAWSNDPWKNGTGQARENENKQWWK